MHEVGLPEFHFHTLDLYLDPPIEADLRYQEAITSEISRPALGTQIWWASMPDGHKRCLKEFYLADPADFGREIPDPIWRSPAPLSIPTGAQRGLAMARATLYDQMQAGTLKQEVARAAGQHSAFRSQFNAYSFELESLITQFARYYRCDKLVAAYFWGPQQLQGRSGYRYVIELEKLEPLPLPPPGDALAMTHRLLEMMSAVVQLHAMLIPIRCYPPELICDISIARQHPIARPFHYDLSPDQFMTRPGPPERGDEVVLIDFNASRTAKMEYSNFSWQTIPGKDYYQAPERRGHNAQSTDTLGAPSAFQSNPIYDLYSLMVIGLFGFAREHDWQQKIQQVERWDTLPAFYDFLFKPGLSLRLKSLLIGQQGIEAGALCALMEALFQDDPNERYEKLQDLPGLEWKGLKDWMLLPRATDYIARRVMGRSFRVAWKTPVYQCTEGPEELSLLDLLAQERCQWEAGPWESGRINHPAMQVDQLFFLQAEDQYPVVRGGQLEPRQAGRYTVYAMWGGCVDFSHPLTIEVRPESRYQADGSLHSEGGPTVPPERDANRPDAATRLEWASQHQAPDSPAPPEQGHDPATAPTPPLPQPGQGALAPAKHQPHTGARPATVNFDRENSPAPPTHPAPVVGPVLGPAASPQALAPPSTTPPHFGATLATPPPPTGPNRAPPPQFEIPAIAAAGLPPQTPAPIPEGQVAAPPDLRQWEFEIPVCTEHKRLDFMETFLQQLPQDAWVRGLQLNVCVRRCQLLLDAGQLPPNAPSLYHLAGLLENIDGSDANRGLLLNNLAVCCYESAYLHKSLPDWRAAFGFDPMSQLKNWLNRTDPAPHRRPSAWIWELRERSRETLAYCQKIRRRLS